MIYVIAVDILAVGSETVRDMSAANGNLTNGFA